MLKKTINKQKIFYIWILFVCVSVLFFIFDKTFSTIVLDFISKQSVFYISIFIFLLGVFRSFTLIPSTYLIILGLLFIPAWPLYFIILSGVFVSSLSVYYFFEYLDLDKMLNQKHKNLVNKTEKYLNKYEFPVVMFWSMNPVLPTDLICYIAGTLKLNVYKFITALMIGEAIVCAFYIFGGKFILSYFGFYL
jgi:uncharacterized membrane protein YdjX (TVP38/TMEM64 family)